MKNLTKFVFAALTAIVLVSGVAVLMPRAVHAVVATFVRDVDNAGRHPWSATCSASVPFATATCTITAPANEEVVIQTETINAVADPSNTVLRAYVTTSGNGPPTAAGNVIFDYGLNQPDLSRFFASTPYVHYADPTSLITCGGTTKGTNPAVGLNLICDLKGYTVSLP